ncbi:peptide/nickel transport system permease protein [Hymenobacter luteus]|uniref:Peptide/nickel transport system permease protein n=2 Tax=Hymenobacter TaxID=89966 RepID=A0A7W9SY70_9BACT|nr:MULTISPECIES: ABC transporter permease [Hymenobacter]MBB4600150.1 peptide/nickel transport system permease protein [Hymenobacter latericoloratus]MBB6057540.1 peptide/nickel transport system permease protein [Hymenobacter luteus]
MKRQRRSRRNWPRVLAFGWLTGVASAALLAPSSLLAPDLLHTNQPPFLPSHWLGTDPQGQDVARALVQGARTILLVSLPAAILTLLLGAGLGSIAGFWGNTRLRLTRSVGVAGAALVLSALLFAAPLLARGVVGGIGLLAAAALLGWVLHRTVWGRRPWALPADALVAGLIVLLDSVPLLILVLLVAAVQRPSAGGLVLLMALTCWTTPARLMRAATLQARGHTYVEAARVAGLSDWQLLRWHIWPVTWPVVLVRFPLTVSLLIGLETTLSFLGVGLPPDTPSWGRLLAGIRQSPTAWWLLVWPGVTLLLTILSLQYLSRRKM